ncbi:MAG: hypothetical protein ABJE66_17235 [Deltaproteobacteria bacterium]
MTRALVACLVVAACGDNQQPVEIAVPYGTPAFVAYKADGTWRGAKPTKRGYLIESVGQYQFVFVCADSHGFDVEELFADTSDGDQTLSTGGGDIELCNTIREQSVEGHINGTMIQPGVVSLYNEANEGLAADWSYDLGATIGRRDLVAVPITGDIVAIRRDIDVVVGPNPQAPIDLASESIPLVRVPSTITGLVPGSHVDVASTLRTINGTDLQYARSSDAPLLLPDSAIEPGERQFFDLDVEQGATDSYYWDHVAMEAGTELVAHLQPPPDTSYATSELGTSVTWQHEALDAVGYELLVTANGASSLIHGVATKSVVNHTLDLSVDRDAPGFLDGWRPTWSTDLESSTRTFKVAALRDGACYETQLFDRGRETATIGLGSRCAVLAR